jgi:hypothetical protein
MLVNQNNQTERRGGKRAKAGRPRGAKSRINTGVLEVVNAIFNRNDPIETANRLMSCDDPKVVFGVWKVCMEFMYGKPAQQIEITGEVNHSLTEGDREAAQKVIQRLLPAKPAIEVEGEVIQ